MTDDAKASGLSDEERLAQLGYTQVLARRMSAFSNYAVSFTIISVLSGCLTLYLFGMNTGGPAVITWGWVAVGLMTLFVGLSIAELCSGYPTSAGPHCLAHRLPQRAGPGGGDGGYRLRRGVLPGRLSEPPVRLRGHPGPDGPALRRDPAAARPAEHLRRPDRRLPQQRQRVVARPRGGRHRRRADLRTG